MNDATIRARDAGVAALLERVRRAVAAQPASAMNAVDLSIARRTSASNSDLATIFATRASSVGMRVTRCASDALHTTVAAIMRAHADTSTTNQTLRTVVAIRDASLAQRMRDCLSSCPATLARDDDADGLFDCHVGITDVDCAIADSGSLVISTIGRMRNAWITPPIHLAIVFESQILADLVDLFEIRNECTTAASTTIITGPSKTADIEGVLVTGVHGPAYVEIVLVADESKHVTDESKHVTDESKHVADAPKR